MAAAVERRDEEAEEQQSTEPHAEEDTTKPHPERVRRNVRPMHVSKPLGRPCSPFFLMVEITVDSLIRFCIIAGRIGSGPAR
jgi:hypothetical protein